MNVLNSSRKRQALAALTMVFALCLLLLTPAFRAHAARPTGTVKNPILNVRSSPSTNSSIVCKLTQGTKVTVITDTTGDDGLKWYDVYFAYNGEAREGFVRADLVNVSGSSSSGSSGSSSSGSSASGTRYVKPSVAIVRSYASTNADIRTRLTKGTTVSLISSKTGADDGRTWYKVSFTQNGSEVQGYIRGDLLVESNPGGSSSGTTDVSGTRYVSGSVVRVRTYASTDADIRSRLNKGTTVSLISSKKGDDGYTWYKVSYSDNGYQMNGYIRSDLLSESNPGGSSSESSSESSSMNTPATVRPAVANIRTWASTNGDIRSKLSQGTNVTIIGEKTGADDGRKWYKISYTSGGASLTGYIRGDLLNVGSTSGSSSSGSSSSGSSSSGSSSSAVAQVRSYASPYADIRATLENGTKVSIIKRVTGEDGQQWTKIAFTQNGQELQGYVPSSLLK